MNNPQVLEIIKNLKGRRNYEEKKALKLGYNSLYAYFEDKILKQTKAIEVEKEQLETEQKPKNKKQKNCGCC